jgi:hypothetical protein
LNRALASADSGLRLNLEITLNGVSAKIQRPRAFSARPKMRWNVGWRNQRVFYINPRHFVELYFTPFAILWAFCRTNRRFRFQKRRQLFICPHNQTLSVAAMCIGGRTRVPALRELMLSLVYVLLLRLCYEILAHPGPLLRLR